MSGAGIEGMVLDKYKIMNKLGSGAMGAVFRAEDTYTREIVALKILAPKLAKDDSYLKRFKREVRSARELNHPNIIRVFDAGEYKGFHYFTMELVEGYSVMDFLEEKKRVPVKSALRIAHEISKALEHASTLNIVHRDVKPENIMIIKKTNAVKLADMGLAKKIGDGGYTEITMAGKIMGTPFYLAPERISEEGDNIDVRADIYSLGATLYHMVVGNVPFQGEKGNPFKVYHQIMYEEISFPADLNIPEPVQTLIRNMMNKNVAQRYPDPKELIQDIENTTHIIEGKAPISSPQKTSPKTEKLSKAKLSLDSTSDGEQTKKGKGGLIFVLLLLLSIGGAIFMAEQIGNPQLIELKKMILQALGK